MTDAYVDRFTTKSAAYVHVPFCSAVCPYCDFAVVAGMDHLADTYLQAVAEEVRRVEEFGRLEAVYFGGGTPSSVPTEGLGEVLAVIDQRIGLSPGAEVSLEANPEDFDLEVAQRLFDGGFNRVSFGAQSFDQDVLLELGRRHGPDDIDGAVEAAKSAGFENISIDLIFGSQAESDSSWAETLRRGVALDTTHVSCYALTAEPGTPLGRLVSSGGPGPDPDVQADRYLIALDVLAGAGLDRYEVSNWSRAGYECRYNLIVWAQGEYEGFGNGAHRYRRERRSSNVRRLEAYLRRIENGNAATSSSEELRGWDKEIDRLFVGLRRTAGVAMGEGGVRFVEEPEAQPLIEAGVVQISGERLIVKKPLLTDAVNRVILGIDAPDGWVDVAKANSLS